VTAIEPSQFARAIEAWFQRAGRDLPWRIPADGPDGRRRNPYHCLVSEAMLQQTQVARVIEKWTAFIARFPTVESLASADEGDVLALWSGLGYYRRARNLHRAAQQIVNDHDGRWPTDPAALQELAGVGRYTAGSIASIGFGRPAPIVDGNVARVLLRVHGRDLASDDPAATRWLWSQAQTLAEAASEPGTFNEGLMELGALVCRPTGPACLMCPVHERCAAAREGTQESIPRPKARAKQKRVHCASIVLRDGDRVLLEQRATGGMWAGMWQVPTIESDRPMAARTIRRRLDWVEDLGHVETFTHQTTHRLIDFAVWRAALAPSRSEPPGVFVHPGDLHRYGISNAQRRVLRLGGVLPRDGY
jgi:A/G-specific adenine glycosylase